MRLVKTRCAVSHAVFSSWQLKVVPRFLCPLDKRHVASRCREMNLDYILPAVAYWRRPVEKVGLDVNGTGVRTSDKEECPGNPCAA